MNFTGRGGSEWWIFCVIFL